MPALILFLCLVTLSFNLTAAEPAPTSSFVERTPTSITGYDADLQISFSSHLSDDGKTILVTVWVGDKRITNRVDVTDPKKKTFELKAVNVKTGKLTGLSAEEQKSLNKLDIGRSRALVDDVLGSTLGIVISAPAGVVIDLSSQKIQEELEKARDKGLRDTVTPEVFTSVCLNLGQTLTGRYTIRRRVVEEPAALGPCYSGECLGRCGAGCTGSPSDKQRYTQECLNHDLCTRATGGIFGPCTDEWIAAADGFLNAPDCADMGGQWTDDFAYRWNFAPETGQGAVTGTVDTGACATWNVTGNRNLQDITLTATNPVSPPQPGCCSVFTYTGNAQCNSASGSWSNACALSGTWNMQRDGAALRGATVLPVQSGPSPAASR
jgi:hypothetical protein